MGQLKLFRWAAALALAIALAPAAASAQEDGTLTFQPGETRRTISVSIKGDRKREADEAFTVQLSDAVGAPIEDGSATVTIRNDD